LLAYF